MKQVSEAKLVELISRNLTGNWEKMCDKYLKEGEARPSFKIIPTTQYIMWATTNFINNCKFVSGEDETFADEALTFVCKQIDNSAVNGCPILDDITITCGDDNYVAEYGKTYTILVENLKTMVTGIRHPGIVEIYLATWQNICFGRYLYEIRNIITDDVITGADMLGKLNNFALRTLEESAKISENDQLSRFEVVTYDREALKSLGVDLNDIRLVFETYNKIVERWSQDFWVEDDL